MRKMFLVLVASLFLGSCGLAESMADMQAQAAVTAAALEKVVGSKPEIEWRVKNGSLAYVVVSFNASDVSGLKVGELSTHVQQAVAAGFNQEPDALSLSIDPSA
jgi:alkylhydroperoxidase/carboxymuconolactone decarboxylase family protein YurZ